MSTLIYFADHFAARPINLLCLPSSHRRSMLWFTCQWSNPQGHFMGHCERVRLSLSISRVLINYRWSYNRFLVGEVQEESLRLRPDLTQNVGKFAPVWSNATHAGHCIESLRNITTEAISSWMISLKLQMIMWRVRSWTIGLCLAISIWLSCGIRWKSMVTFRKTLEASTRWASHITVSECCSFLL